MVCLPYPFHGGTEGQPGIGESRFGKFGVGAVYLSVFLGLAVGDVGADDAAPGRVGGVHFGKTKSLGIGSFYLL